MASITTQLRKKPNQIKGVFRKAKHVARNKKEIHFERDRFTLLTKTDIHVQ